MNIQVNESGLIDMTDLTFEQVSLLAAALNVSPDQSFLEDKELRKMFKLLAILQSDVFKNSKPGAFDFTQLKP